jgi:pyruvate dehydrogenase E2 component (dihydrolipoamide acetyltransferase)
MPNVDLVPKRELSSFRMIAIGTWRTTKDPSVYGSMEVEMDEALAYIRAFREQTGRRLTVTHMVGKVLAAMLEDMPDANAILRFHRIYLRKEIGIFFQVVMEDPDTGQIDLSGVTIRKANERSLLDFIDTFEKAASKVRAGKDQEKEQTRQTFKRMPGWLTGPVLDLMGWLMYTLNLDMRWAGLPQDPFGSVMVTNIGSLGLKTAYVPLVPYSRVPLLIAIGAVEKKALVGPDDTVRVGQVMGLHATFDHRIIDGAHAAHMSKMVQRWFADPWTHFGGIERP